MKKIMHRIKSKIMFRIDQKAKKYGWYGLYFPLSRKYDAIYHDLKGIKKIFFLMMPEYGNLGDQAIALATERFICDYFPEYRLICVTEDDTYRQLGSIKKVCGPDDLIFLQGGGNMGSMYPYIEYLRRFCIRNFPQNVVVSMPVTATYLKDGFGNREFKRSLKVYNSHKRLILLAREKYSYEFMKKNYSEATVMLVPDIVFYLYERLKSGKAERNIPMVCLRKEMESGFTVQEREVLIQGLLGKYPDLFLYDTEVRRTVEAGMREAEVKSLLGQFARARFVLTDRMHGMILAAITGTPCVALKSLDNKIPGTWQWVKNLNYIRLTEDTSLENILNQIARLPDTGEADQLCFDRDYWTDLKAVIVKNTNKYK